MKRREELVNCELDHYRAGIELSLERRGQELKFEPLQFCAVLVSPIPGSLLINSALVVLGRQQTKVG